LTRAQDPVYPPGHFHAKAGMTAESLHLNGHALTSCPRLTCQVNRL
jgi:hypothetical protein